MANNIYSLIRAYFQYQLDIGVEDVIFEHGSGVCKILAGGQNRSGSAGRGGTEAVGVTGGYRHSPAPPRQPEASGAGGNADPLAGLSRIRTVDAFDVKRGVYAAPAPVNSAKREKLAALYREVINCGGCRLSQSRAKVVFGAGSADGKLFVIGSDPLPEDEAAGLPFQGELGELFGKILGKMGLDPKRDVFSTYLQKCCGGGGFDRESASACRSIIDKQIGIICPKAVLVFGQPAANIILGNDDDMELLRKADRAYMDKPVVVTYPLSLMLADTRYRHGAWEDMKRILNVI